MPLPALRPRLSSVLQLASPLSFNPTSKMSGAGRKIVMDGARMFSIYNKKDVYPIVGIVGCALV